jgi:spoIIIJ-associated protein
VQAKQPDSPRVRVDIDHYRASQEHRLLEEAEEAAERVISSGEPVKLEPMNSYHRRIVHNHFKDHPELKTWSPQDSARLKRIVISMR